MPLPRLSLIAFLSFAGLCWGQPSPTPSTTPGPEAAHTGLEGNIRIRPSHPGPERPGIASSGPLANTTFVVTHPDGSTSEFATDDQGHFKVLLAPGHYSITRKGQQKGIGRCGPFDAFIAAGQITRQDWQCDSGMR